MKLFNSGTRLNLAEQVSQSWRSCIRSNLVLWRRAYGSVASVEEMAATTEANETKLWRKLWVKKTKTVCQHCLSNGGKEYPLFPNVQLCWDCRYLEPYNGITKSNAERYLSLKTKKMNKFIEENNIILISATYRRIAPWDSRFTDVTLYQFKQLLEIVEMVFGEEKALAKATKARQGLGIRAMHREFIEEL